MEETGKGHQKKSLKSYNHQKSIYTNPLTQLLLLLFPFSPLKCFSFPFSLQPWEIAQG